MDVSATLRRSARYAWASLAFLIISYALLVIVGRLLLPTLEQRREQINQQLSTQLGMTITSEGLSGSWTRLTPQLQAQGLSIAALGEAPAITVSSIESEFDILRSIVNTRLVWSELRIGTVKLSLREDADGRWSISNFPISEPDSETTSPGQLDLLSDIALLSRHIGIEQIAIDTAFYDGTTTTFYIDDMQVESQGNFHRTRAKLSLGKEKDRAQLLIEGRGDPKDWQSFDGKAYIKLSHINLHNALGIILRDVVPLPAATPAAASDTLLNAELWITSRQSGHFDLRGKVQADEIPLNWGADLAPIKNLDTTLTGWFNNGKNWGLQCQNLRFDWGDKVIQPLNISFQQGLGEHWREIALAADHINIDTLKHGLVQTQLGGENAAALLKTLNPSGQLQGVQLSLDLGKPQPLNHFSARIEQLSLDSWHHTPATRGLSGFFHWQGDSGYFDIDSGDDFAMHYPGVYTDFMHYGATQGRVNIDWTDTDSSLQIAGGPIDIHAQEGDIRAYISLDIPTTNNGREPQMFLQAGIKNSHSRYRNNYLPAILDPNLLDWLERAIGDVDIVEAGFIWRGSLKGMSHQQRSIQFYGQLANGEVNYDPGWPKLSELSAQITVDNAQFDGIVNAAKLGTGPRQAQLEKAVIATRPGALLAIKAQISSPLSTAIGSLLDSPLASQVAALQDWDVQGWAQAELDLVIPLSKNRQGEAYRIAANIERGRMQLSSFQPIIFSELAGSIAYNDSDGLHSSGLSGSLWGQALNATIATHDGQLRIDAVGLIDLAKAPPWHPLLTEHLSGTTSYTARFSASLKGAPPTLTLLSDLQGIAIDMPSPLHKTAQQIWPLETSLQFRPSDLLVNASTDDLDAQLRFAGQQLTNGIITLGKRANNAPPLPEFNGLLINGHTREFDLNAWLATLHTDANSTQSDPMANVDTRAMVTIDHLSAVGFIFDAVTVDALRSQRLWDIDIENPIIAGNIRVAENSSQAIVARLNYLSLPSPELDNGQGFLNDLDPSTLPALDFATEGLRIGDSELGSLAFVMQPNEQGVSIDQIDAEITGITIANTPDSDAAQLIWTRINGEHRSQFNGALLSDDLGGVLQAWDMPVGLTTDSAIFLTDLRWQGKPWDLSANTVEGLVALSFDKGRFFQATDTATNALLKVIGLINFDTWLRRLKFDFSDLFSKGVDFDHLEGGLAFEQAQVRFEQAIVVTLPSGKLRLLGQTNLVEETIDARLIATLPVGTNLPWIAALIGGLPAAAGVYFTSKIFAKQVDRISSISYKISGDLNNPEVEVDRIFSDKTE
ncbi:MAG: TIGR02099 family protein [Gammaproteobacteria bacterium]|nr:TIGR02099 family protein [Gammaproteobacteria bacterium]MBQ0838458.1 TIGR02099 family protein [Gammaproteobacteria bacterium]